MSATGCLRVVVTVKQVLDPEAPSTTLQLDADRLVVTGRGTPPVLDPYSLHALHAALGLRAAAPDPALVDITVVGVGPAPVRNLYLKALGAGADRALLVDATPPTQADTWWTAAALAALVDRAGRAGGGWDLVLVGRRAADTNAGAVGPVLARLLGVPVVTLATALRALTADGAGAHPSPGHGQIEVDRLGVEGLETWSCPLPAVVTVSHEVGELPYVELGRMIKAKAKSYEVLAGADLGLEPTRRPALGPGPCGVGVAPAAPNLVGLERPRDERNCTLIEAADARQAGRDLARLLLAPAT